MARFFVPFSTLFAGAALLILLTGGQTANAADQARQVNIVAKDGSFDPSQITASPGEPMHLTLTNRGTLPHSITFILPSGQVGIEGMVQPGSAASMDLTVPNQVGQYVFYCPVDNHRAMGMEGKLVVQKAQ